MTGGLELNRRTVGIALAAMVLLALVGVLLWLGPQVIIPVAFCITIAVYGYVLFTAESEAVTTQKIRPMAAGQIIGATLWMLLLAWGGFWS